MRPFFAVGLLAFATRVFAQGTAETQVTQLVKNFGAAEQAYDTGALSPLIIDRFIEVSPAGEIDGHDRFSAFIQWTRKCPGLSSQQKKGPSACSAIRRLTL